MKLFSPLVTLLSTSWLCLAQAQSAQPSPPGLTFLYSLNCTLAPAIDYGATPFYNRTAIPITGGTFTGPRLNGTIKNLGADWGRTDSKGVFHPDTRYHLQTNDGAAIYIQTQGPAQTDGLIHLRIIFETGHPDYYWLNYVVAVGILEAPPSGGVLINAWQIDSPKKW